MIRTMDTDPPLLLYDGKCSFCQATIQFVLRHDRKRLLRFATVEGIHGRAVIESRPELENIDSIVWVETEGERVLIRSDAALQIAGYLGRPWSLLRILKVVPRGWRDGIYDFVARHRHRLKKREDNCMVPAAGDRDRFLDDDGLPD